MQPAELNYEIYDKELLAIFEAFRQWHNYLKGSAHVVLVLSDHKNLEYFVTTKQLTRCQVCWSEYLSGFNYMIHYRAGQLGTKPDALTHREDVYPRGENAYALANPHNFQSMFKAGQLLRAIILDSASLLVSIRHGLQTDMIAQSHLTRFQVGPDSTTTITATASPDPWSLSQDGNFLCYKGLHYVPDNQDVRLDILCSHHDHCLAGHPGITKTIKNIRRQFLLAPNGRLCHQLHPLMFSVQSQQVPPSQALWPSLFPPNWRTTMGLNLYGLHRGATPV